MDAITIVLVNTPTGVLIRTDADLARGDEATRVAVTLLRLSDGLFEGGKPVRLAPAIVEQVL